MMPRPRRAGLAIVVLFLSLVAFVSAAPDLDDCALRCVTISATTACNIDSFRCVCQTFANPVRSCISTICPGADGTTARTQFEQACSAEGVTITSTTTTTTPPAPTNPTTPSTSDPPKDTTTEDPPPASGTRTPNNPANPAGSDTHSSSDVPTGSPGATDTSNPSAPNNSSPVQTNIGNNDNDGDSDAGGSSIGSLIGAIVGGLIGGLLVVALVWFILRRRRRRFLDDDDGGVLAYSVARTDNMSYMNEPKHDSSQPILMDDFSSHKYSTSGSGFNPLTGSPSPHSSPAPAGVPFARGPGSTADSQGSYAARPVIFDTDQQYLPRKGDPPRVHVIHTGSSIAPESVAGSSSRGGDGRLDAASPIRGPADDSASVALTSASAQELTPEQLNLVQTMVNRGLPGTAVVDVIQRMLADNQAVPPEYRPNEGGTLLPPPLTPALGPPPPLTPGIPPPPLTPAAPASATSGSSTQLPYRQSRS